MFCNNGCLNIRKGPPFSAPVLSFRFLEVFWNSFCEFDTKIFLSKVLQNFKKTPSCSRWPKELNQKGFPRNIQYRTRPEGPFLFFRHCEIFRKKFSPLQFFRNFATKWMLKNPKGIPRFFGIVRLFLHKRIPNSPIL